MKRADLPAKGDYELKNSQPSEVPKRGRPTKILDMDAIGKLVFAGYTMKQIAKASGISCDTLRKTPGFRELYGHGGKPSRPRIVIDMEEVLKLSIMHCTHLEIADYLGINVETLTLYPGFSEVYSKGIAQGKISLRRYQWKSAKDSVNMQQFLGKQYLGQKEKIEHTDRETPRDLLDRFNKENPIVSE